MEEQFVTYPIALKLKGLGFNEECAGWIAPDGLISTWIRFTKNSECHGNNCALPLWQQAIDWFREEHNVEIFVNKYTYKNGHIIFDYDVCFNELEDEDSHFDEFKTYQKAREQAILKAIELISK